MTPPIPNSLIILKILGNEKKINKNIFLFSCLQKNIFLYNKGIRLNALSEIGFRRTLDFE